MPWKECHVTDERSRFVARLLDGEPMARLCAVPAETNTWTPKTLADHRKGFHAALRPVSKTFTAHSAIDAVRRALPKEGVLTFDVGGHTHQIGGQWPCGAHRPDLTVGVIVLQGSER